MKELEIKDSKKLEFSVEKLQQKERQLEDVIIPKNGHKVFEINIKTLEVLEAEFDPSFTFILGQTQKKTITVKTDCVYVPALNKKTALDKYKKGKFKYETSNFKPIKIGL